MTSKLVVGSDRKMKKSGGRSYHFRVIVVGKYIMLENWEERREKKKKVRIIC